MSATLSPVVALVRCDTCRAGVPFDACTVSEDDLLTCSGCADRLRRRGLAEARTERERFWERTRSIGLGSDRRLTVYEQHTRALELLEALPMEWWALYGYGVDGAWLLAHAEQISRRYAREEVAA